ncbi:MAG TPA: porin, partial [Stenotrophomonas sp.]|nr:porin [Stenotrophomonas sp.]
MELKFAWQRPAAMMALAALAAPAFAEDDRPVTATVGGRLHLDFA